MASAHRSKVRARPQENPGLTRRLAEFSSSLAYDDLAPSVVVTLKRLLLDTLGTALAATTLGAGCREVIDVMLAQGGKPESTILGTSQKVAAPNAAFANGALAHALNYDPIGPQVGHVGVVCLAAPLAVAEAIGPVSGRQFLAAVAVAAEVTARLNAAIALADTPPDEKFLTGQILGYFGAAAGAGRLLGLTAQQMHSAFGLALMQAAGSMQVVLSGDPPAKAVYGAFPNHGGVLAALLSRGGLGGECDAFEGPAGLYALISGGAYQAGALTGGLGVEFALEGVQFKPWPTSAVVHPFIEAATEIARAPLAVADIRRVQLIGHSHIRPWCEPLEERRRPRNAAAAANSVLFGVAKALCNGDVTLRDFTAAGLSDPRATGVTDLTIYALDDRVEGGMVRVETKDGRVMESHVEIPLGHPSRPLSHERLAAKFADCCSYAATPLSRGRVDELLRLLENLDETDDVCALAAIAGGV